MLCLSQRLCPNLPADYIPGMYECYLLVLDLAVSAVAVGAHADGIFAAVLAATLINNRYSLLVFSPAMLMPQANL